MKILNINAVYAVSSTGRTIKEMHEYFLEHGIESYVAATNIERSKGNFYKIGNVFDRKLHAFLSRIFGLQAYFSTFPTLKLCKYIKKIEPDVVILHNIHSNCINLCLLLNFLSKHNVNVVFALHDSWFYTGRCVYYCEDNCYKWKEQCGKCPALKKGNASFFADRSRKMLLQKRKLYKKLKSYAVVGVSKWVEEDAKQSILGNASIITHVYNWIPFDSFNENATSDVRTKYKLEDKKIILCVASNWNVQKGYDLIVELSLILPKEMQIILAGDCTSLKQTPNIIYLGNITDTNELAGLYACSDVFLNPSVQETFGKTTAESMSCGTPVVLFNNTASPELIGNEGECGVYIENRNAASVLKALQKIFSKPKSFYKTKCIERSRSMFDKETNIKKYINIFKELDKKEH